MNSRFLSVVGMLIMPAVLSANHGAEAIGVLAPISAALIAVVVCLVSTLIFLFRKKWASSVAYMLFVLNFGLGILLLVMASHLDVIVFFAVAGLPILLGILVVVKTIRNPQRRS